MEYMKKRLLLFLYATVGTLNAQFTIFHENFDLSPDFQANGWVSFNVSNPAGTVDWGQGTGSDIGHTAYNGVSTAYVASSYLATTTAGTISDWLISPVINFQNGDTVSFYTLSYNSHYFPDRLECRLSTSGTSTDIGNDENSVGDFTTNLVTVNPLLDTMSYPSYVNQNSTWTLFTGVITGLSGQVQGRIAFRYFVPDAGPGGNHSSTIGIDGIRISSSSALGLETELNSMVSMYPNPAVDMISISLSKPIDGAVFIYDMAGKTMLVQNIVSTNQSIDISSLPAGSYLIKIAEKNTGKYTIKTIIKK
jgi:hypothetical protein